MIQCGVNKFPDKPKPAGKRRRKDAGFYIYLGNGRVAWDKATRLFFVDPLGSDDVLTSVTYPPITRVIVKKSRPNLHPRAKLGPCPDIWFSNNFFESVAEDHGVPPPNWQYNAPGMRTR
jgi:hypothetical protein